MRSPFDSTEPWAAHVFPQPEVHAQSALAALDAPTERELQAVVEAAPSTQRSLELPIDPSTAARVVPHS